MDRKVRIYRVTLLGSLVNFLLIVFKFVAGILGHSAAMVADAVHSLSDFITDIIVLVFVKISAKPADSDHDFGHGKYETLASALIGLCLIGVGGMIGYQGVTKIIFVVKGGELESPGIIALIAALVSIALKEWLFRLTRRVGKDVDSPALEANAWHHRSDALSSIGTAVGIGGAIFLGHKWTVLDPVASVIVCVFIVIAAVKIMHSSVGELVERSLPQDVQERIKESVYKDSIISDIHNLRTRRVGDRYAIDMHVRLPGEMSLDEAHEHVSAAERRIRDTFGGQTLISIHVEPVKKSS